MATIRKRRDKYEVQAAVPDFRSFRTFLFSSALRLGFGRAGVPRFWPLYRDGHLN